MEDLRGLTEDGGVGVAVNEVEVKLENISNTENSSDMDRFHLSDIQLSTVVCDGPGSAQYSRWDGE